MSFGEEDLGTTGPLLPGHVSKVAVLASGEGTNLQALIDSLGEDPIVEIVAFVASREDAPALTRAQAAGISTKVFDKADFANRPTRDLALAAWLIGQGVGLVVLAGWMELLTATLLDAFPDRVVNVHPSLLPEFPGMDAVGQAVAAGAERIGVTVHLVDEGVDTGRVLMQEGIDLPAGATAEEAAELLRPIEHRLLPEAVRALASGRLA
ncbi:MAG: phosphoribosylglycinamide formyltransferase [Actinobacteria bacterium]|uniref:phosphoribosylglycinamide formyltransferase 1 n=1 Tax=freshwater metagenome TaxID=449393 RepID=A0A6J7DXV2_9ZZZZ|nr:phosphoribosylglycinamide formyltransferase [Actinomycetota bacterium]